MNRRAFGERVTAMQGSLYRVAASYLRGENDRLDAVAEAIAKAWEKRQTLRDEALFATWMTRILIRVCVDMQRRQKRMIPTEDVAEGPAEDGKIAALREAGGDDFSWDTALLARGIARRKAGEEWYEITGAALKTGTDLSDTEEETTLVPEGLSGALQPRPSRFRHADRAGCARAGEAGAGRRRRVFGGRTRRCGSRDLCGLYEGGGKDGLDGVAP